MSNSNYPAGVSDNHPYFNPPRESATAVECGADSALVVPSFAVKAALDELRDFAAQLARQAAGSDMPWAAESLGSVTARIDWSLLGLDQLEQETEYECPFNDEIDLEESECARWDCPVCGNERETDNLPEERDPDYEYDRRGDDD